MDKMINYIFSTLHDSENTVKFMKKQLQLQSRFNRKFTNFTLIITAYVIVSEIHNYERDRKIEKLSKEIEELKRMKGV